MQRKVPTWFTYGLFGLFCFIGAFIYLLPAQHWLALTQRAIPELASQVRIQRITGNLFAGKAQQLDIQSINVNQVRWRWLPHRLLSGAIALHLEITQLDSTLRGQLEFKLGNRVQLRDVSGRLLATPIFSRLLNLTAIAAVIEPQQLDVSWQANHLQAIDGSMLIEQIAISSIAFTNSQINIAFNSQADGIQANLSDLQGAVQLQAELSLQTAQPDQQSGYRIVGRLTPRQTASPQIKRLLSALGSADNAGSYAFDFSGHAKF